MACAHPIDFLEGATVVAAAKTLGYLWKRCIVTFWIDNSAFQLSGAKGQSRADRLNKLLVQLLELQIRYDCIFRYQWISTKDNYLADHLSRGRVQEFLEEVYASGGTHAPLGWLYPTDKALFLWKGFSPGKEKRKMKMRK